MLHVANATVPLVDDAEDRRFQIVTRELDLGALALGVLVIVRSGAQGGPQGFS